MKDTSETSCANNGDDIAKAVTKLAHRISALEAIPASTGTNSENTQDLAPAMSRMLADLKSLRTELITATSDLDERLEELKTVKTENQKLKYRVLHLLRSLDAEEK